MSSDLATTVFALMRTARDLIRQGCFLTAIAHVDSIEGMACQRAMPPGMRVRLLREVWNLRIAIDAAMNAAMDEATDALRDNDNRAGEVA